MKSTLAIVMCVMVQATVCVCPARAQEKFAIVESGSRLMAGPPTEVGTVADLELEPGEIDRLDSLDADRLNTLLCHAVADRNLGATRTLLEIGAAPDGLGDRRGYPLWRAVANRSQTMVRLLLEFHADPNCSCFGRVALIEAARYNATAVVQALLEAGANPQGWDRQGMTALDYAVANQNATVVALLRGALGYADTTQGQPN